jgi:hypothetical protein
MLTVFFALTQAISTVVIYAKRLDMSNCLDFDHCNGAMGIASTICSVLSILVLLFGWTGAWAMLYSHRPQRSCMHLGRRCFGRLSWPWYCISSSHVPWVTTISGSTHLQECSSCCVVLTTTHIRAILNMDIGNGLAGDLCLCISQGG